VSLVVTGLAYSPPTRRGADTQGVSHMADTVSGPALQVSYEDDPRVVADAAVDDYAMHVVPETGRVSRGKLMMAFWGVMSAMFYVVTGAAVAAAVGTKRRSSGSCSRWWCTG